ncbi:MAG: extracellular solute-binding protein [Phycisphaerae bacterium]|nr:extracellular solute-binding protein [Phycisphaerae bacterium]
MTNRHCGKNTWFIVAVVAVLALGGLVYLNATRTKNPPIIYVGTSMQKPMAKCVEAFKRKTGIQISANYEDSGDVFAHVKKSGFGEAAVLHEPFLAQMKAGGYTTRTETLAYMTPIIAVKKGNPKSVKGLKDFTRPDVKIGLTIAKETTSGRLVQQALKTAGIQKDVMARKPVENKSSGALVNMLQLPEPPVDAVTVWNAVAGGVADKVDIVRIEPEFMPKTFEEDGLTYVNGCVPVGLVVLKTAKFHDEIRQFVDFMISPEGQAIWKAAGFDVAKPPTTSPEK